MPSRLVHGSWYRAHLNELVVLAGLVVILAGTVAGVLKVYQTADNTHRAVCALRHDRIVAIANARSFLVQHPNGIPGISRADIQRSIVLQAATVRAFRFADC